MDLPGLNGQQFSCSEKSIKSYEETECKRLMLSHLACPTNARRIASEEGGAREGTSCDSHEFSSVSMTLANCALTWAQNPARLLERCLR